MILTAGTILMKESKTQYRKVLFSAILENELERMTSHLSHITEVGESLK